MEERIGNAQRFGDMDRWQEGSISGLKLIHEHSGDHVCVSRRPGQPA